MRTKRERLRESDRTIAEARQLAAAAELDVRRLQEAIDRVPAGIVVTDEDGRVVARNDRAAAPTGDRQADVLITAALDELVGRVAGRAGDGGVEETVTLHGPPPRTVRIAVDLLPAGGSLAVVEDLSERSRLDAVRRDFVANVGHELRTPVGALGVLADALEGEQDLTVVRRLAGRISAEVERASTMITELLDLNRLEAGGERASERVDIQSVIEGAVQRVAALAERRDVRIEVAPVPDRVVVIGDPAQLLSAVMNLLDNAINYSEAGTAVSVGAASSDGDVVVRVSDQGIGIPARDLDRNFERFYRVDRARARRTGGTGLGLAIVRHAVTNHGGTVEVTSVEGEGSTFTIRLPEAGR
jgi:two-component system sensor histidine kinase SenX3